MEQKVLEYIKENNLFTKSDNLLLAISGGVDSMVLMTLLNKNGYNISIANCNFNLRGEESDLDTTLVKDYANNNNIISHSKSFNTVEYSETKGISIEMAARELRYEWFNELCQKFSYKYIVLAHHLNDQIETVMINLCRGTGIKGITGMGAKTGKLVRPLLCSSREEIELYAYNFNIPYRNDSTNNEIIYTRNKIRHKVIPTLKEINPNIESTFFNNLNRLKECELIYSNSINEAISRASKDYSEFREIDIKEIQKYVSPKTLLFEIINQYGFNSSDCDDLYNALKSESGKIFYSETHQIIKDRDSLIISEKNTTENREYIINSYDDFSNLPIELNYQICIKEEIKFSAYKNIAYFDLEKIKFPLVLRRWKDGDIFHPFGMKGRKKLSDYFTDNKFSLFDKQNSWILTCQNEILWLVNHRSDDRFKVTNKTYKSLIITTSKI